MQVETKQMKAEWTERMQPQVTQLQTMQVKRIQKGGNSDEDGRDRYDTDPDSDPDRDNPDNTDAGMNSVGRDTDRDNADWNNTDKDDAYGDNPDVNNPDRDDADEEDG